MIKALEVLCSLQEEKEMFYHANRYLNIHEKGKIKVNNVNIIESSDAVIKQLKINYTNTRISNY